MIYDSSQIRFIIDFTLAVCTRSFCRIYYMCEYSGVLYLLLVLIIFAARHLCIIIIC